MFKNFKINQDFVYSLNFFHFFQLMENVNADCYACFGFIFTVIKNKYAFSPATHSLSSQQQAQ